MRHSNIDQYARDSNYFIFDSRIKIIAILIFVIFVALLRDLITLIVAFCFVISFIAISGVPGRHIFKRYLLALPFIIFASLAVLFTNNIELVFSMYFRISSCVLALIILSCTTPFFDLLKGLQSLKLPGIFIVLLMFTYRYFFVFIEELHRMRQARIARGFTGGRHLFDKRSMRTISYTAGMLLIRAYQRGVRIYDSLLVRGFDGKIRTLTPFKINELDMGFGLVLIFMGITLFYFDWLVIV
jgi:cobalt/nickel transport system permease protein